MAQVWYCLQKKYISWRDRVYSPLGKYELKNKGAVTWRNAY